MLISKSYTICFAITLTLLSFCRRELIINQLPQNNSSDMVDENEVKASKSMIEFAGYKWIVTHSPNKRSAPGNNYWSKNSVWVDENGFLHLILKRDSLTNKWFCAEIKSEKKFGNGKYQFWINGSVDKLDKNVVFGLFKYSGIDFYDEIDIEFARWGNLDNQNLNYTVYPAAKKTDETWGASKELKLNGTHSVHQLIRSKSSIKFDSYFDYNLNNGYSETYSSPNISKKDMPIYINLWAFRNMPPADGKEVEIILEKFVFEK